MAIRILGDRVLVALPPKATEVQHESGLTLVRDPELRTETRGIVVAIGEKSQDVKLDDVLECITAIHDQEPGLINWHQYVPHVLKKLRPAPFDVAVNDCVIFAPSAGELIEDDYLRYVILRESDIIAVIEPYRDEQEVA